MDRAISKRTGAGSTGHRIRTVDGLRGVAALLVVFDHTVGDGWGMGAWSEQNHGIVLFAVLTGFLLSGPFLRARLDGRGLPPVGKFLRARAARIFPGYWMALAIAALTVGLNSMGGGDALRVITLTQTLGTDTPFEGIPPAWSLSLFLSFYLAIPLWAWWRARSDRRTPEPGAILRNEVAWLGVIVLAALAVRLTGATDAFAEDPVFTLLGRADWFALGMLIAVIVAAAQRGQAPRTVAALRAPGRRPGLAVLAAVALTTVSALIAARHVELRDQIDTAAAGLLIAAAVFHGPVLRGPQRLLASRPARALGRWSYGIFLWGYIAQKAILQTEPGISTGAHLALAVPIAVLLGAASWRWIERPASLYIRGERERIRGEREEAQRRVAAIRRRLAGRTRAVTPAVAAGAQLEAAAAPPWGPRRGPIGGRFGSRRQRRKRWSSPPGGASSANSS